MSENKKKLPKSSYLTNFGPISEPPDGQLGFPGPRDVAQTSSPNYQQNHTSFWGSVELTFDCKEGKTVKNTIFGQFWAHFRAPGWPVRLHLIIASDLNSWARTLTIMLFKQRQYRAYNGLQIQFSPQNHHIWHLWLRKMVIALSKRIQKPPYEPICLGTTLD